MLAIMFVVNIAVSVVAVDHFIIKCYVDALTFKHKGSKCLGCTALLWREVDRFVQDGDYGTITNRVKPATRHFPTDSKGAAVSGNSKGGSRLEHLY